MPKRKIMSGKIETQRTVYDAPLEVSTKATDSKELLHKTLANLTDVVSQLQHDVKKIKVRLGL